MSCGDIRFLEGGIIKGATILDSQLANCLIQQSTFDAGTITNLANIDTASVEKILDGFQLANADKLKALAKLLLPLIPPDEFLEYLSGASDAALTAFAKLLFEHLAGTSQSEPDTTVTPVLPTKMYGDHRKGVMGGPDTWISFGQYLLPGYTVADNQTEVQSDFHLGG